MFSIKHAGLVASLLIASAAAMPANAATVILGGATADVASVSYSAGGLTLDFAPMHFNVAPSALTNLSQLTQSGKISITAPGIGVAGGGSAQQVDTNSVNAREAILVSASDAVTLTGLKLSYIDANDTLQIFGVGADGSLTSLGFDGIIKTGLAGAATAVNSSANSGTTVLTFNTPKGRYDSFLFTTQVGGEENYLNMVGQGYRIDSITASVPEPATWAMLIAGFGLVGVSARRRRLRSVTA